MSETASRGRIYIPHTRNQCERCLAKRTCFVAEAKSKKAVTKKVELPRRTEIECHSYYDDSVYENDNDADYYYDDSFGERNSYDNNCMSDYGYYSENDD